MLLWHFCGSHAVYKMSQSVTYCYDTSFTDDKIHLVITSVKEVNVFPSVCLSVCLFVTLRKIY